MSDAGSPFAVHPDDRTSTFVTGFAPGGLRGESEVFTGAACPSDVVGASLFLVADINVFSFLMIAPSALILVPTFSSSDDPPLDATSVGRDRGMFVSVGPFWNFAGFVMLSVVE